jgi:hypothetical protein
MELKMKAICEGRKTQREVIEETVEQYRAVYVRTQQRLNVLKAVRLPSASLATTDVLIVCSLSESMCLANKHDGIVQSGSSLFFFGEGSSLRFVWDVIGQHPIQEHRRIQSMPRLGATTN